MPSKHQGHPTIAFRPSTKWQYSLIEERAKLSGMHKKDFITRSCIYSRLVVVGTKENIQLIIDEVQELKFVIEDVASQLKAGNFSLSDDSMDDVHTKLLATCITATEILDGAAYLFDKEPKQEFQSWKSRLEL